MEHLKEKLEKITTFIFDFDGVLSDGKIYVLPDGDQIRATSVKDGYAIQYALKKGYRVAINGTHGRIETLKYCGEAGDTLPNLNGADGDQFIDYYPIFGGRERISIPKVAGEHSGGDPRILEDIFLGEDPNRKYDILA